MDMQKIIIGFCSVILIVSCGKKKEFIKASYKPITISVYASGIIKSGDQYQAYGSDNGILEKILVSEGDSIARGDVLFQINNRMSRLNSDNAKLALELSRENSSQRSSKIKDIEMQVTQAKDKLNLDSTLYERQKKLWEQNVGTKVEFEQKELAFKNSKSNYLSAKARLELAKLQVDTEYKQAQNNLKISQEREGNFLVRSEIDGVVYNILKEKGEFVTSQTPLAIIGRRNSFYIELQVDEYDIVKIAKEQEVFITMDSYKNQVFKAKVSKVYPIMDEKTRTFRVDAVFTEAPKTLYPNLTVEANILLDKKERALVLPRNYVLNDSIVKTVDDEQKRVKTGLMNYDYVEIISGIDSSTQLVKP